jgi:hypothetical protein
MGLKPIAQHLEHVAATLRLDARTLRRAVEIGDGRRALELATHIEALASELAADVPTFAPTHHHDTTPMQKGANSR